MNEKELKKLYNDEWKKKEPSKYLAWLICNVGTLVPLAIAAFQLIGGLNDDKVITMCICLVVFFVLEITAAVIMSEHKKGWKAYLELHKESKSNRSEYKNNIKVLLQYEYCNRTLFKFRK